MGNIHIKIALFSAFIIVLTYSNSVYAEALDIKVARNAANCLTGHIATKSKKYQSGHSAEYLHLIRKILGDTKATEEVKKAANNLKTSVQMLGGNVKDEGAWLVKTYCPRVDEILAK